MTTFILSVCVVRTVDHVFSDRDLKKGFERLRSKDWWASHWKQAQRQTSANGDATGTDDKDTIHLMLPIWVRRAKRAWYTEDDPQWKANQSFAKDKKRRNEVAHKIVALVGEQLQNDAYLPWVKYLQALNVTMDMDLILPISPPAYYEVPCLFIPSSGDISYGWRRLPDSVGAKMDRIFHPVMLTKAFYAGCKEFARVTYVITKARVADRINASREEGDAKSTRLVKMLTEEEKANRSLAITKTSDETMKRVLPFLRGEFGEHDSRQPYRDAVRSMTYKGAIEMGCIVFRSRWIVGQSREMQKTSGSVILFKGLIRCVGDKGKLQLEVSAFYDVATNSLIGKPVIGAAHIVPHPDNWHAGKSQGRDGDDIKSSPSAKPAITGPARETAAANPSPVTEEEK